MVVIDHKFFPHILDEVWANFPYSALPTALLVSKDWNARAKACLGDHFVITPTERGGYEVRTRSFDFPHISAIATDEAREFEDGIEECEEQIQAGNSAYMVDNPFIHWYYNVGGVIDIKGYGPNDLEGREGFPLEPRVAGTARWTTPIDDTVKCIPDLAWEHIFFLDLSHESREIVEIATSDLGYFAFTFNFNCYCNPASTSSSSFGFDPDPSDRWSGDNAVITVILNDERPGSYVEQEFWDVGFLYGFIDALPLYEGKFEVSFVGLETFFVEPELYQGFKKELCDCYVTIHSDDNDEGTYWYRVEQFNTYVTFHTMEEYRAKVGKTQYRLATIP